jgi:hypothetical protein
MSWLAGVLHMQKEQQGHGGWLSADDKRDSIFAASGDIW